MFESSKRVFRLRKIMKDEKKQHREQRMRYFKQDKTWADHYTHVPHQLFSAAAQKPDKHMDHLTWYCRRGACLGAADGCLGAAANHSLVCRYCLHGFDGTPPPDQTEHYLDPRRRVLLGTYYCPLPLPRCFQGSYSHRR